EPDAPTPAHVVEAAVRALRAGATRYVEPAGVPPLRDAVARHFRSRGIDADAARVVVTSGAKALLHHVAAATLAPGDEALVPDPGYSAAAGIVRLAGARPVPYPVCAERGIDVAGLESLVTARTRLLVLNSPHNPTGAVLQGEQLDALADLAHRRGLLVLSDEIYWRHVYDGAPGSIATRAGMAERTVVVDGLSKAYAMTGWRLGFGVMPEALAAAVTRLVSHSTTCVPPFVQEAGIAALEGPDDDMAAYVAELRTRRDWLVAALGTIPGIRCAAPRGAFYVFPCVRGLLDGTSLDTAELAHRLLDEAGVACVAGSAYGARGEGHLRLSFAAPLEELREAMERIRRFVSRIRPAG
ncbi:MAG TPA: pyridoxal phosphate-dependent aminotransferase, partial [Gemmatimonadales bacterium]